MKKTTGYISIVLAAALLAGCDKDQTFGEQNRGKERPTVGITVAEDGVTASGTAASGISVNCTFTITVSEDSEEYAFAVLYGNDPAAPDAYSILVGEVSGTVGAGTYFYNEGDGPKTHSFSATIGAGEQIQNYTIYAVSITSAGLTSDVTSYVIDASDISEILPEPEPDPDYEVQQANYNVEYTSLDNVETSTPNTGFLMVLRTFEGERGSYYDEDAELYMFVGRMFNMAAAFGLPSDSNIVPPALVGALDRTTNTITFDRMVDQSSITTDFTAWTIYEDSPYETVIRSDAAGGAMYMLRGGGSAGTEPVVMTIDEKTGEPLTLSACSSVRVEQDAEDEGKIVVKATYDGFESAELVLQ